MTRTAWGTGVCLFLLGLLLAGCDPGSGPLVQPTPVGIIPSPTTVPATRPTPAPPTLAITLTTPVLATPAPAAPGTVPSAVSGPVQPGAVATEAAPATLVLASPGPTHAPSAAPPSGTKRPAPVTTAGAPPAVATGGPQGSGDPVPGQPAPNFVVTRLDTGARLKLSDFAGRPVWINFWASWCDPCKAEMPVMQQLYQTYQTTPLVMLGIDSTEDQSIAQYFVTSEHYGWLFAFDASSNASMAYQVPGLPTHIFINRNGIIQAVIPGGLTKAQMQQHVQALLR